MTVQPSPYEIIRAIEDQQAVIEASQKATARLVKMLTGMLDKSAPEPLLAIPLRYHTATSEIATPESLTAAQSEAAAGSIPEQGADASTAGDVPSEPASSPAVDDPASELAPAVAVAEARPPEVVPPQPPADEALKPEKLAAVDVTRAKVFGPGGNIFVNTRAARALDVLKHGDLFGFDQVAVKAKIPTASECRHALRIEEASLRSIGLEVWTDKLNARLREVQ
jgi:hypothetical protein